MGTKVFRQGKNNNTKNKVIMLFTVVIAAGAFFAILLISLMFRHSHSSKPDPTGPREFVIIPHELYEVDSYHFNEKINLLTKDIINTLSRQQAEPMSKYTDNDIVRHPRYKKDCGQYLVRANQIYLKIFQHIQESETLNIEKTVLFYIDFTHATQQALISCFNHAKDVAEDFPKYQNFIHNFIFYNNLILKYLIIEILLINRLEKQFSVLKLGDSSSLTHSLKLPYIVNLCIYKLLKDVFKKHPINSKDLKEKISFYGKILDLIITKNISYIMGVMLRDTSDNTNQVLNSEVFVNDLSVNTEGALKEAKMAFEELIESVNKQLQGIVGSKHNMKSDVEFGVNKAPRKLFAVVSEDYVRVLTALVNFFG
eukprot:GAHX01001583.1.p1 GENE.GAHX01001583.1~~GAHX01001583.1.p1  ORF type:complete len:368 (-),score=66.46 GAHX01001583.1:331-1434(-)